MRLLILGGTVFLGRHLAEVGLARGHEITLFNRGLRSGGLFPDAEQLRGDRRGDLSALSGRRWDAVIDTCGYVPNVVRASARLLSNAVEHYTFVSSQSVYANFEKAGIDENHTVQELTDEQIREAEAIEPGTGITAVSYGQMYGGLKALCERTVEQEMPGRTLSIRAGLIVGPHDYSDRFTYWVRRIADGGEVLAPGHPLRPVQFVDVRDLAEWIVSMAESRQTGVLNATGPEKKLSMQQLLETLREASGSNASFTWVNDEFLISKDVAGWSEVPLWLPASDNIDNFFSVDCSIAINSGLAFRSLYETARDTLAWDKGRDSELRAGLSRDRELELLHAWHKVA